jgi:arabinose-5-phosphate isomerase
MLAKYHTPPTGLNKGVNKKMADKNMLIAEPSDAKTHGRNVIMQEAEGLLQLAETLDTDFIDAVRQIVRTQGRVIVAGMGKSGHVGRKIAATLSATGSSAFFVHPAEASHGDLGLLKSVDTMLILSNSGATSELRPLIAYAKSIGAPIIGVASDANSLLMREADFRIQLPKIPEACPELIAPTTSTTMMLAVGDALAIAAMRERGISRVELMQWHPGGAIGWRMLPVDSMLRRTGPLPLVTRSTGMRDVVLEMTSTGKGVAGVVDDHGNLVGIITDGDLRRSFDKMLIATAGEIMTVSPKTVASGTRIEEALALMSEAKITVVFVMREDDPRKPAGVLHIHDIAAI